MNNESPILPTLMQNLRGRINATAPVVRMGEVVQVTGLVIESVGPNVSLGDICEISSPRLSGLQAEVVGFRDHRVLLMPLGEMQEIHAGCDVAATGRAAELEVGAQSKKMGFPPAGGEFPADPLHGFIGWEV